MLYPCLTLLIFIVYNLLQSSFHNICFSVATLEAQLNYLLSSMASLLCILLVSLSLPPLSLCTLRSSDQIPRHHIVYMGASSSSNNGDMKIAESGHLELLSSIIPREERERATLGHVYHHAFRGFSAMLTDKEASLLSAQEEIVSVFPDPTFELHTTRSWDFLEAQPTGIPNGNRYPRSNISLHHLPSTDVIIGMIDTGNMLFF